MDINLLDTQEIIDLYPKILKELKGYGDENTKKIYMNIGAKEPVYGVKVQDLKKILKKTKKNHKLSLDLYASGNSDAMYLAGLIITSLSDSKLGCSNWFSGSQTGNHVAGGTREPPWALRVPSSIWKLGCTTWFSNWLR